MDFRLDVSIYCTKCNFNQVASQSYNIVLFLNKTIDSAAIELNVNPLHLRAGLECHISPFDATLHRAIGQRVFSSIDGTSISVDLPKSIVLDEEKQFLISLVMDKKLLGLPAKCSYSKKYFETFHTLVPEYVSVTPQFLSHYKWEKVGMMNPPTNQTITTSYVTDAQLASVSNMLNMSALHIAAMFNFKELCLYLVRNGQDAKKRDSLQRVPCMVAKLMGNESLFKFLYDVVVKSESGSWDRESFLWMLNERRCKRMVYIFVDCF